MPLPVVHLGVCPGVCSGVHPLDPDVVIPPCKISILFWVGVWWDQDFQSAKLFH